MKIKKTEKYKWVLQDKYEDWFNNRESILNFSVINFLYETSFNLDTHINETTNFTNVINFFQTLNSIYYNNNRRQPKSVFMSAGLMFHTNSWLSYHNCFDLNFYKLDVIMVYDNESNIKFLVDKSIEKYNIFRQLKTVINNKGFSSRKDVILVDNLNEMFIEEYNITNENLIIPFEKMQEKYLNSQKKTILKELKESIVLKTNSDIENLF